MKITVLTYDRETAREFLCFAWIQVLSTVDVPVHWSELRPAVDTQTMLITPTCLKSLQSSDYRH